MIALYKIKDLYEDEMKDLFQEMGYRTACVYSINNLMDMMVNPMVIITPSFFQKELKDIPNPIVPIFINVFDIKRSIVELFEFEDRNDYLFITSNESIDWLRKEYEKDSSNNKVPLTFITNDETISVRSDQAVLAPIWMKNEISKDQINQFYFIKPSFSSVLSSLQVAGSLVNFIEEVYRERYQVNAIVNSTHDGVIAIDLKGTIKIANEHAKTWFSFKGSQVYESLSY